MSYTTLCYGRNIRMNKIYATEFKLSAKMLAIIDMCYIYKFPASIMLSFYELYGDNTFFALKALTCARKLDLTDTTLVKIIDESNLLYKQIQDNIRKLELAKSKNEEYKPELNLNVFSANYRSFIEEYLLSNIENLYTPIVKLKLSSDDLYRELQP